MPIYILNKIGHIKLAIMRIIYYQSAYILFLRTIIGSKF
ncbi:hypothetical protein LDG_6520 [Legionella drancourtii LLAP12]|uniref:Uncharacterized protein n=1 Tax=Legionella drancourtii LLAP12 TaxID=658187 RepID=G9EMQ0_9GAMM|nr:hypothetical protein LDG_6520 [Legionella drancourtii LLAP12]